jgi:hypothetical protein
MNRQYNESLQCKKFGQHEHKCKVQGKYNYFHFCGRIQTVIPGWDGREEGFHDSSNFKLRALQFIRLMLGLGLGSR